MVAFLADECVAGRLVRGLRDAGFDVACSTEVLPAGSDNEVLALANREGRVLLTEDNDFGDLAVRLGLPSPGIVRIDLGALDRTARLNRLIAALTALGEDVRGALATIEPNRTRVRRLSPSPY